MKKKKVLIVGGGTAGIVIANNLAPNFDVTVIEKSRHKKYPLLYKIPMMIGILFRKSKKFPKYIDSRNFCLANGRAIPFFESKVLGGASVINGCVHTLGMRSAWEKVLDGFGFIYEDLECSYSKIFSKNLHDLFKINLAPALQTSIDKAYIESLGKLGIPEGDIERSDYQFCGSIYNTSGKFFRSSIMSLLRKKEFTILLGRKVEELLFDVNQNVIGVVLENQTIEADYVVLTSGVLGTNHLLMSQVSRGKLNFDQGGKEMGRDVQDHVNLRININSNQNIGSFNEIEKSLFQKTRMLFRHLCGKPNLLRGTGATSGVHLDLDGDGIVDTRIQVVQFTESGRHGSDGKYFGSEPGFSLSITPINPYSKGEMILKNGNLIVNPGYLSDQRDIDLLIRALHFCINLLSTEPISGYVQKIVDLHYIQSDPRGYIMDNVYSGHHLIGGLGDAVDSDFLLRGSGNLFVCDASVLKQYPASNIHSSVVLLADLFSNRFSAKYAHI